MTAPLNSYQAVWLGIGAFRDYVSSIASSAASTAALQWASGRLAELEATPGAWPWSTVASWGGVLPNVAPDPEIAKAAWLARLVYSLGYVHGPLAELGWMQATPETRARYQAIAVATASAAIAQGATWRDAHPVEAAAADAAAKQLAGSAWLGDPSSPAASTWTAVASQDDEVIGLGWVADLVGDLGLSAVLTPAIVTSLAIPVGMAVLSMATKTDTETPKKKRRRRRSASSSKAARRRSGSAKISSENLAVQTLASGAVGIIAGMTTVLVPVEDKAGAKLADRASAMPAVIAGLGGLAVSMVAGRNAKKATGAAARGIGDGLAAVAAELIAVGAEGRAALHAITASKSKDAKAKAKGQALLSELASGAAAASSTQGRARSISPAALELMQRQASQRLGLESAGVYRGPGALTGAILSGPGALTGPVRTAGIVSGPGALTGPVPRPRRRSSSPFGY